MNIEFEKLHRDVLIYIALQMDAPEILSLCRTNSRINEIICENDKFWMNKVIKDYPEIFDSPYRDTYGNSYKEIYELLSQEYMYINIDYAIEYTYYDDDDKEQTDRINVSREVEINTRIPLPEIKNLIYDIVQDFTQYLWRFGYFDIEIDNVEECRMYKRITKDYFDSINHDTKEVSINFDSHEQIDPDDEDDYEDELKNIVKEQTEIYQKKYN